MVIDLSSQYIDLREMAAYLNIGYTGAVYRIVARGAVPIYQFGARGYYAKRSDWEKYIAGPGVVRHRLRPGMTGKKGVPKTEQAVKKAA